MPLVLELLELEAGDRRERRVDRLLRASKLPPGKTFESLHEDRLRRTLVPQLHELASGAFLDRTTNVFALGLPGTGKTHATCALGHALVQAGHSVLFVPTFQLVQELLLASSTLRSNRPSG